MGTNITGIGNANAIGFKSRVTGGAYFPPELKDALVGVWSAYGKSNDSTDRNIIKNKIKDRGGDFELINFNYEGTSGYNGYPVVFGKDKTYQYVNHSPNYNQTTINVTHFNTRQALLYSYIQRNGELTSYNRDYPSYKIKVSGLEEGFGLMYQYNSKADATSVNALRIETNGIYTIPKSFASDGSLTNANIWVGFVFTGTEQEQCNVTIEVLPEYKGAVVTDGVDDMIISTKTVSEMLEGSNEVTVISMIRQIKNSPDSIIRNNWMFRPEYYLENRVSDESIGKSGIYGYTSSNISGAQVSVINNILGDKNDYTGNSKIESTSLDYFSVEGFRHSDGNMWYLSQVAWYWTFIAKRVLTEDEINLVIEKYNLDRPGEIVKPQVYYNVKKQKISNDNHSAFDDKLIDYSGNGYDAKLYNFGWKEDSGIGKYETDFTDWKKSFKVTSFDSESIKFTSDVSWVLLYHPSSIGEDIPSFKVRIKLYGKGTLYYNYITQEGKYTNVAVKSEIFETPICYNTKYTGEKGVNVGFTLGVISGECSGTITQIPEYENALVLDGVDDYGKVTGLPILKDYTVAADYIRTFAKENAQDSPILSKSKVAGSGAFLFNYLNADSITSSYSFGTNNILKEINDSERKIYYLSKYASDGHNVNAGSAVDYDTMWLGTYKDNISNFFTGALYFAMLFPYSLSEFLLERQIKKARAGTLYPNQVEFRPIIPEDENITKIDYFVVNSGTWTIIKPGDYVDVGARIVFNIYTKLPYKVAGVSSTSFTGMSIRPSTGLNIFDVQGYIKDKTPQKIKLTLAVNEDIIQWNPTISANIPDSYDAVTEWFANGWETKIAVGDWIKKSDRIFFKLKLKEPLHEIGKVTFGGSECQATKASNWSESNNLWEIVTYSSVGDLSQVFNVQVDEYIRYEDIVQPYPILLRFNDENGNGVSWGGKFRVGSTITRIGSIADPESNLLNGLYSISGLSLNGKAVTSSTSIVEKQMVFKTTATWLLDNSKPKCILSPSRLRIPNSSYKLLGYIPDISGHGNHGKINNSAYAGMSGVNGYPVVFGANKTWANESNKYVTSITNNTIHITNVLNAGLALLYSYVKYNGNLQNIKEIPPFKIEIKGLEGRSKFIYKYLATSDATKETNLYLGNGTHELPKSFLPTEALISNAVVGFSISPIEEGVTNFLSDITIKVLPEYEGAYCLDGVDDFVTIPTTVGGKQVLMKVNWDSPNASILYDQRGYNNEFAIYNGTNDSDGNPIPAYQGRNNGQTYIDGILNSNIKASELRAITHNITITNELSSGANKTYPIIGSSKSNAYFVNMALYDFMLFDEISTDDKIKELNEYIGLSGNIFEFNPPTFTIDLPMAIKNIKVYQGGNEISPGYLYPNKDTEFEVYVSLNDGKYAVDTITVDDVEITKDRVVGEYNIFKFTLNGSSEQKITIHSYEYIMYEDIIQPYPSFVKLENLDRTHTYTWGDKLRIGDTIRYNSSKNLLEGAYTLRGQLECNGVYVFDNNQQIVVTKEMVFAWSHSPVWTIGNSAPKCVFSPSKLRIPNSSYKYLGYIPDISGNGNHGVFNNFAFSKMSGADGYPYDYKSTSDFVAHAINAVLVNSETVKFINVLTQTSFYYKGTSYKGKIKVTGITKAIASGKVRYLDIYSNSPTNNDRVIIDKDGIYDVNIETEDAINIFFYLTPIVSGTTALDEPVYLEQVGNYEGSICFDGVDDYMDIPSLSIGGKQVLMKTNWLKSPTLLYDQRASGSFAILTTKEDDATNPRIAYQARNQDGKTYIDGIENNYIETYSLKGITHNITVTNPSAGSGVVPVIGANTGKSSGFAKMALYDFMLFDEVSTNEEIKQLNDIVGIEGNYVQRPPYYWDTHGKSNLDGDRGTIPQLGTAEDYSFTSFDNEIDWYLSSSNYIDVVSRNGYKITLKNLSTGIDGWRFQNSTVKRFILNDIPFKIKSNKTIRVYWDMHYNAISSTELRQKVVSVTTINPNEDTLINLRHLTEEELTELNVNKSTMYYLLWFDVSTLAVNEEVTIEMLPVEGGRNLWLNNYGFAYDKMSGYEGYSFKSFNDSQSWNIRGDSTGVEIISRNGYSMTVKKLVQNLDWQISNNEYRYPTILDKEVPFKCKSNKNVGLIWQLKYKTEGATSDTTVTLINQQLTPNVPLEISLPYKTQDELTELGAVSTSVYYLLYFSNTLLEIGEEYTVEMLPLYPNGLVYDGVDDYSENTNIPAFTDYTYIIKYEDFNNPNTGSCIQRKGSIKAGGGAFVQDHIYRGTKYQYNFGISSNIHKDDSIAFCTRTNYNGTAIPSGNNTDDTGFTIGKFDGYRKMVFYKEMLYPRTVNMLTINMIKNMMAEDGIIDIQGKLFTDKFTGDFNLDFNKDFLIGN